MCDQYDREFPFFFHLVRKRCEQLGLESYWTDSTNISPTQIWLTVVPPWKLPERLSICPTGKESMHRSKSMLCCGIIKNRSPSSPVKNKYSKKIGNNLLVHTKPMTFQYKQPYDKTGFLPFVGKTIVIHIRLTLRLCEVPIQLLSFSSVSVPKTALFYNAETKYKPYKEACACMAMYFRSWIWNQITYLTTNWISLR